MKLIEIKEMYPGSVLASFPLDDQHHFILFDGTHYLSIDEKLLNSNEKILLRNYFKEKDSDSNWKKYLQGKGDLLGNKYEDIQLIHFYIGVSIDLKEDWLTSFRSFFDDCIDQFFIDSSYGILICKRVNKSNAEINSIINMLDDDYGTNAYVYIGAITNKNKIKNVFDEEKEIFLSGKINHKVNQFIDVYLSYYVANSMNESFVANGLREIIKSQKELPELIMSLWNHYGNITAVAKDIYVHRNTINYRIEKLNDEYGIDLKNTQQLFLCYLLLK